MMATAPPSAGDEISTTYTSLIQQYLNLHCYVNAAFLAERYVAHHATAQSIYLLALSYYRTNEKQRCRMLLLQHKPRVHHCPSSKYLLAQSCFDLGYYDEAQDALLMTSDVSGKHVVVLNVFTTFSSSSSDATKNKQQLLPSDIGSIVPNGAVGLHLLGQICRKTHRLSLAKECYRKSLQLDPFMMCSFLALCEVGGDAGMEEDDAVLQIFGVPLLPPKDVSGPLHHPPNNPISSNSNQIYSGAISAPGAKINPSQGTRMVSSSYLASPSNHPPTFYATPSSVSSTLGRPFPSSATAGRQPFMQGTGIRTAIHGGGEGRIQRPSSMASIRGPTALFGSPNLTPIHGVENSDTAGVQPSTTVQTPSAAALRAAHVAARLYYDESPETKRIAPKQRRVRFSSFGDQEAEEAVVPGDRAEEGQDVEMSNAVDRPAGTEKRILFRGSSVKKATTSTFTAATSGGTRAAPTPMIRRSAAVKPESEPPIIPGKDNSNNPDEAVSSVAVGEENRDGTGEEQGVEPILSLLATLGQAYWCLCNYQCQSSLHILQFCIPLEQYSTGWVMHQIGRAHFEMVQYPKARAALEKMTHLEPHRMAGLDILSTILWHLKDEVHLSTLAQRVVEMNKLTPESWCVVGNCLSLQKEHETALIFFQRAIQLDDGFTYAYTLSGHEYVANEDLEKASMCFRKAIQVDERHYNAWYGLGAIYYRQEKYDLAEYHFERALRINPQSSVLYCHLGMVQFANHKTHQALKTLERAFELDPDNIQARYQKATILIRQGLNVEALRQLELVRDSAPREPSVYFTMGKICKTLGLTEDALRNFVNALDLDPKDSNLIKAAMDRLDEPDIDEDVSTF